MDIKLNNKTALVCGSSQGIGKAIANELANLGASVVLLARDTNKLEQVKQTLTVSNGQQHTVLTADFSKPATVQSVVSDYLALNAPIDILINNTGGPPPGPANEATPEAFQAAFDQHLLCNQLLVQSVLAGMKQQAYGRIINIISTSVKQPIVGLGVSNTIRGAVANWSKTLANELGVHNITVNNVLPGATETGRLQAIIENKAKKQNKSLEEIVANEQALIPMKRFGKPEELANVVAFLASSAAAYVTGVSIPVDGGRTNCL